ncbi:outer membrane protein [Novosphingobium bradum]|uniref:Outer membrane protein n=1 Tax=Novosphingobium bradum TaxID=1737444 RepID=A0ABV7IL85_9SPHN
MRKIILPVLASLALATPALANEARVEARGGVYWLPGNSEATAGVAAGYDYDLGSTAFVGAELSADKILTSGTKVAYGFTGRAGAKLAATKLFVAGGYTTEPCTGCEGAWHAGAGAELPLMGKVYGKVEYRHFFVDNFADSDSLVAGVGIKF